MMNIIPSMLRKSIRLSIESDIYLSDNEQIHLDQCLSHLYRIYHIPLVLNCTLLSASSISNSTNITRVSLGISHYLRVRQPHKFYWMLNIKEMYLSLRLPTNKTEQITANLIEFHSCKRLPYSARTIIQQIKPILLVYHVEEHLLKLNIHGENSLLQLIFSSDRNSTEQGHNRSTTIQFDIDYQIQNNYFLI